MTDQPPAPPDPPAPAAGGGGFCAECGTALEPGATFCGSCGTATEAAPGGAGAAGPAAGGAGASTWTGVQPVVERPTEAVPPVPPGPPTPTGPAGPGGPPPPVTGGKGKGPLIAVVLLVVAALAAGAFFLLGGDDDDDVASEDTTTTEQEDEPEDEETTTTTEADEPEEETTTTAAEDPLAGIEFTPLTDATGQLTVEVPSDWTDSSTALEGANFPNIQASTDLAAFRTGFDVPGMSFSLLAEPPASFDEALDFLAGTVNLPNACTSAGKDDYTDGVFTGRFEVWEDCGGVGTQIVMIVASRADGRTIEINTQLVETDPVEIVRHIAETFNIVG